MDSPLHSVLVPDDGQLELLGAYALELSEAGLLERVSTTSTVWRVVPGHSIDEVEAWLAERIFGAGLE